MTSDQTQQILHRIAQNRLVQHGSFWALSLYVLFKLFNINEDLSWTDWIYTLLFHLSLVSLVYINTLLLIPNLLRRNRYLLYLLSSALLIVGASVFNQLTFTTLADWIFPGYYFISYYEFKDIFQFMAAYWAIGTSLKLSKSWFLINEKEKQIRKLEQQKTTAELQALKAQLNPHFLFNSLNNIYSLALYEDKKTPEALLQLSQCLRYVLYDCKTSQIELEKELNFLKYYMDLQALRSETNLKTNLLIHGQTEGYILSPLLFIPLLENAYKHAKPNQKGAYFIKVNCQIDNGRVSFEIQNSVPVKPPEPTTASGVGIENLKKRLNLLYPQKHLLQLNRSDTQFEVKLQVPLTQTS